MANGNPKEGLTSENNHHINLKVARKEGSVVWFKCSRREPLPRDIGLTHTRFLLPVNMSVKPLPKTQPYPDFLKEEHMETSLKLSYMGKDKSQAANFDANLDAVEE
ncbi:hypothetical protein U0070_003188 [Myodes glareolus]|uniref:Uncharacterized protein n=1 Tax=Myodes glareolus TaxID=447135 RepID=A0AAW0HUY9_MYOGA